MKILVVDEERPVRWPLGERLTREGYGVVEAENGRTARAVLEREAPDLVLGYAAAYQNHKTAAKGGVGGVLFEPNADKWSGDHASTECSLCPGMLFSNRKLAKAAPNIQDLGVTALRALGASVPPDYEGDMIL